MEIIGSERVEGVKIVRNELHKGDDGVVRPEPTDITDTIPCGLVFRSIGYRGVPLEGVPFDEQAGVIPNEGGRIGGGRRVRGGLDQARPQRDHRHQQARRPGDGRRAAGGRRAPAACSSPRTPDPESLEQLLTERKPDHVTYAGWEAIDRAEREAGEAEGRPRVKLTRTEELLEAAREKVG